MNMHMLYRLILLTIAAVFIVIASFGVQLGMLGMSADSASACPFSGEALSMCPMTIVDHIVSWKQLFVAWPQLELMLSVLLLFVSVAVLTFLRNAEQSDICTARRCYFKYKEKIQKTYNYFNRLFAQGILHSRLYA